MAATLLPKVIPAPSPIRSIHRSLARETPAPSGEDFNAALNEARGGSRAEGVERKQERPAETQATAKPSRKTTAAKSKKDAQEREDAPQPVEAAGEAATPEKPDQVEAQPEEITDGEETVIEEKVAPEAATEGELTPEGTIDPALLVQTAAAVTVENQEGAEAGEEQTDAPLTAAATRAALIKPVGAEAEPVDEAGEPVADEDMLLAETEGEAEAAAIDLADLSETIVEEMDADGPTPEAAAKVMVPATTKTADATKSEAASQPLAAATAAAEAETGEAQTEDQANQHANAGPRVMSADADEAAGPSANAATFEDELLLKSVEKPGDQTTAVALGGKTQQVIERQVVQQGTPSPLRAFVQENHEQIVSGVRTQLLPNGGSMQIRLSPGDLGQMQITVRVIDGALSATFQTSSDDATRLLSHSLTQLKSALESQGVSVDRIQVTQAPREAQAPRQDDGQQQQQRDNPQRQQQQEAMQQEQQRRQLLNRMWARMAGGGDPLDLVA
jgi:flagellar hook-length control protein FliK